MEKNATPVQSVNRIFDIIEALSVYTYGVNLKELSEDVGLHTSTTHRLLSCLLARGYARKDEASNKYVLTPRLFEISSRTLHTAALLPIALPDIEHLADITKETIHLVVRQGNEIVYVYKEDSNNSVVRMASYVGRHGPMHCTGVGKSILAYLPISEVKQIWDTTSHVQYTPNTIMSYPILAKELEAARRDGVSYDNEENEVGVSCIAAPLFDYLGSPIAAISISFPTSRITPEQLKLFKAELLEATKNISASLGGAMPK